MTDEQFQNFINNDIPENLNIQKYLITTRNKLKDYKKVAVSYSGGSDSDIIIDLIELVKPDDFEGKIKYIFFNTGLEYNATLMHVKEIESKYGVSIEQIKPEKTIPTACKESGIPFLSKDVSGMLSLLQRHNFLWSDSKENSTFEKYGRCKSGLDWYFDCRRISANGKEAFSIKKYKFLKDFIIENPPNFKISDKCCFYAKKNVSKKFDKEFKPDLKINGMRQSEGGRRIGSTQSCFNFEKNNITANYRPLWFWSNEDKQIYKDWRGIHYSDCYEAWGFVRVGCVGCPCNSKVLQELEIAEKYEPQKVKAAKSVFGKSYEYRDAYNNFKNSVKSNK